MPTPLASHQDDHDIDHDEVEWQLDALDVRPVERWLLARPAGLTPAVTPGDTRAQVDAYLDTAEWSIHRAGFALRVRRRLSGASELTLKALVRPDDGLSTRREITETLPAPVHAEASGAGAALDVAGETDWDGRVRAAPGLVGRRVRALAGPRRLRPLFEVRNHRQTFEIRRGDVSGEIVGQLALDRVTIPLAGHQAPFQLQRVEVEAAPGVAPEALEAFVAAMRDACGLRPTSASKFEVGLLAHGLTPPAPLDLGPVDVRGDQSIGDAALAVLRRHWAALLRHEPGTRLGDDPEPLHDMRVAIRRLRAGLGMFADALPAGAPDMRAELGWLGRALGAVRDLDVQIEHVREWQAGLPPGDAAALEALLDRIAARRDEARAGMLGALDSPRRARFAADFTRFVRQSTITRSADPTTALEVAVPVLAAAPALIERRYRKLRKRGDAVRASSPPDAYHAVRIDGKRLRYAVEAFADVYGKPARTLIRRLVALQDLLGAHQDACVAVDHLRELVATEGPHLPPPTVFIMGRVAERYERQAAELRAGFKGAYRGARGRPWKDLREALARWQGSVVAVPEHRGEDDRHDADDDRAEEGGPEPVHSESEVEDVLREPRGEQEADGVDHQREEPQGQDDERARQQHEHGPDERVDQPDDDRGRRQDDQGIALDGDAGHDIGGGEERNGHDDPAGKQAHVVPPA